MSFTGNATYSKIEENGYPYGDITPEVAISLAKWDRQSTWKQMLDKYLIFGRKTNER